MESRETVSERGEGSVMQLGWTRVLVVVDPLAPPDPRVPPSAEDLHRGGEGDGDERINYH